MGKFAKMMQERREEEEESGSSAGGSEAGGQEDEEDHLHQASEEVSLVKDHDHNKESKSALQQPRPAKWSAHDRVVPQGPRGGRKINVKQPHPPTPELMDSFDESGVAAGTRDRLTLFASRRAVVEGSSVFDSRDHLSSPSPRRRRILFHTRTAQAYTDWVEEVLVDSGPTPPRGPRHRPPAPPIGGHSTTTTPASHDNLHLSSLFRSAGSSRGTLSLVPQPELRHRTRPTRKSIVSMEQDALAEQNEELHFEGTAKYDRDFLKVLRDEMEERERVALAEEERKKKQAERAALERIAAEEQ